MTAQPSETPANELTVHHRGFDLAVYEFGDPEAETVILVHGWPDTHHLWNGVIPLLAQRFHVVAYDTRGHGASTRTAHVADYRLTELAADFYAVADAVSPGRPVHVLAHDWGSVQVWEAVCEPRATERIASFTSVSGPNLDHLAAWVRARLSRPTPRNIWQPFSQLLSSAYTGFFMTPGLPRFAFGLLATEQRWRRFIQIMNNTAASTITFAPTLRQDMVDGLLIYRANIFAHLRKPRPRTTEVPVQLIVAGRDIAVRPSGYDDSARWVSRLWRRDVPAGHWMPFSHAELLSSATAELVDAARNGEIAPGITHKAATGDPARLRVTD